jgi:4-amino-4-deoxy-L-arabinose transferase-like glycosyltransferase
LLAVGALLRVVLLIFSWNQPLAIWDERDYNALALGISQRFEFAFEPGQLTSLRPPLYPALVAGIYTVFGAENFQAVRAVQCLLSLANAVLLYFLGKAVMSPRVGLWAAGLYCFYPSFLAFNNLLLTEVLFTFLLCAACYALIRAIQSQSLLLMLTAGSLFGLAALTRSVLWLLPVVLLVYLLWAWRESIGRKLLAMAAFTLAFGLMLAPWSIRNSLLQETFVTVDVMGGRNFMMGNYRHTPLYRAWDAIRLEGEQSWHHEVSTAYPPSERDTQGKIDKLALKRGLAFIRENPGLTLQRDLIKWVNFWGLEREIVAGVASGDYGHVPKLAILIVTAVIFASYTVTLLAGIYGMMMAPPADRRFHVLFLLVMLFICGMHVIVFGHSRYHLPLMPLIFLYTASSLVHASTIWQRRRSLPFLAATAIGCLFAAGWAWEIFVVDLDRFLSVMKG